MLNKPALCELMQNIDSKYSLVIMVAKRARSVIDRNPDVVSTGRFNAVSMALREVADGNLHWRSDTSQPQSDAPEQATEQLN